MNLRPTAQGHPACLLLQQLGGGGALSRSLRMFALFLSRLGRYGTSPSPLLCCPRRHAMKGARGKTAQGSGIPVQGSHHPRPSPAPALPGSYLWEIKRTMGDWEGEELEPGTLVQDLLCSACLRVRGTHTRVGSGTCVKEPLKGSLQPALSIVSLTARCRPPPPLHV